MKPTLTALIIVLAFFAWLWNLFTPVHPKYTAGIDSPQWQSVSERVAARIGHHTVQTMKTPL